jgi:hypothetical protein
VAPEGGKEKGSGDDPLGERNMDLTPWGRMPQHSVGKLRKDAVLKYCTIKKIPCEGPASQSFCWFGCRIVILVIISFTFSAYACSTTRVAILREWGSAHDSSQSYTSHWASRAKMLAGQIITDRDSMQNAMQKELMGTCSDGFFCPGRAHLPLENGTARNGADTRGVIC